ncbi:cytochrome b [Breoghania sp.]|uniref:cytochrome b n=1 Tax=Breoghania sp. TaxID=2065378 RepID=UPI0029CA89C9|nr:cytochrome b [Breoghania sp.]
MLRNSKSGYGLIAILFHWSMALLMFGVFGLGLYMHELPQFEERTFALYQLHKSFGFTILALVVLRLMWRFANPAPRLPGAMPLWEKAAAHGAHAVLYALMFAIPLSGWLMVSASPWGIPTVLFDTIPVPHLPVPGFLGAKEAAESVMKEVHELLAWAMIVLVAFHAAAAIKHHLIARDDTLRRMLSPRSARA